MKVISGLRILATKGNTIYRDKLINVGLGGSFPYDDKVINCMIMDGDFIDIYFSGDESYPSVSLHTQFIHSISYKDVPG